ncbi:MAG TPA: hypothetical protein VGJ82_08125 [Thermoanaerobaculia bacterium]
MECDDWRYHASFERLAGEFQEQRVGKEVAYGGSELFVRRLDRVRPFVEREGLLRLAGVERIELDVSVNACLEVPVEGNANGPSQGVPRRKPAGDENFQPRRCQHTHEVGDSRGEVAATRAFIQAIEDHEHLTIGGLECTREIVQRRLRLHRANEQFGDVALPWPRHRAAVENPEECLRRQRLGKARDEKTLSGSGLSPEHHEDLVAFKETLDAGDNAASKESAFRHERGVRAILQHRAIPRDEMLFQPAKEC